MNTYGDATILGNATAHLGDVHNTYYSGSIYSVSFFKTSSYEEDKDVYPPRTENTCSWFLGHPKYTSWNSSNRDAML